LGKAILAFTPESQWANHLPDEFLPRTSCTHLSFDCLSQDLVETKARGYSLDEGENEDGAYCIGVPVFNHLGRPAAAISLSAPAHRLKAELTQEVAEALTETATTISHHLGYQPK
jgi:DNA-binding IclR family transcriptional regulator